MKKTLYRIKGPFYKGASARGYSPPTWRLIMMIWDIRGEGQAPQHIGNFDGMSTLKELLTAARTARHNVKIAAVAIKGNAATCYTFRTFADFRRFFDDNSDLTITDKAIGLA
jgi:hypothetical protein